MIFVCSSKKKKKELDNGLFYKKSCLEKLLGKKIVFVKSPK